MSKIRVFVADDHIVFREGIRALLEMTPDIEVVGEAGDGTETVARVMEMVPDVVLLDITMPGKSGLEAAREIKKEHPEVNVLILTIHDSDQYLAQAFQAGASGYVVKTTAVRGLVWAIRTVNDGDVFLYPSVARMMVDRFLQRFGPEEGMSKFEKLTKREKEIVKLVADGYKNAEIAQQLGISLRTVQAHRANVLGKLGAHDRTDLVKYAIRNGIISN